VRFWDANYLMARPLACLGHDQLPSINRRKDNQ